MKNILAVLAMVFASVMTISASNLESNTNTISSDNDKVIILEKSDLKDYTKVDELKTAVWKYKGKTKTFWTDQAIKRIKKQAAEKGYSYIYIEKVTNAKMLAYAYKK